MSRSNSSVAVLVLKWFCYLCDAVKDVRGLHTTPRPSDDSRRCISENGISRESVAASNRYASCVQKAQIHQILFKKPRNTHPVDEILAVFCLETSSRHDCVVWTEIVFVHFLEYIHCPRCQSLYMVHPHGYRPSCFLRRSSRSVYEYQLQRNSKIISFTIRKCCSILTHTRSVMAPVELPSRTTDCTAAKHQQSPRSASSTSSSIRVMEMSLPPKSN